MSESGRDERDGRVETVIEIINLQHNIWVKVDLPQNPISATFGSWFINKIDFR